MDHIPEITSEDARKLLDAGGAAFVDIRDPDSFHAAHIPGATHLTDETVHDFLASADRARPVVVYCYHGHSSLGATAWLQSQGFSGAASLSGGFSAWAMRHPSEPTPR